MGYGPCQLKYSRDRRDYRLLAKFLDFKIDEHRTVATSNSGDLIDLQPCRLRRGTLSAEDLQVLQKSQVVLLAGGAKRGFSPPLQM